jgi:hypothetical protein
MHTIVRAMSAIILVLALLCAAVPALVRGAAGAVTWPTSMYPGANTVSSGGAKAGAVPSYSLSYPPGWTARGWPDTRATYGQLSLWSPNGGVVDVVVIPLRPRGPVLNDLVAEDASFLTRTRQTSVTLPLGRATQLSGAPTIAGLSGTALYLQRKSLVYRFNAVLPSGPGQSSTLLQIASSLHVPAAAPGKATPIPSPPPSVGTCCHCPAWGVGWGRVLADIDGIAVYSNAGNIDNGCTSTYGISYQCVELVQRYFSLRWGYPAIWQGVAAAADMRTHHPDGIEFIPNGGSPGPKRGDALLFYGGAFGHVALVARVDMSAHRVRLVEENWSTTGIASLTAYADGSVGIRDSTLGSYVVAGWLHSLKNAGTAPTPTRTGS